MWRLCELVFFNRLLIEKIVVREWSREPTDFEIRESMAQYRCYELLEPAQVG